MPIFLHGLALQNYRGIGPQTQRMAPFRDFNFFIGANNSGKSTVLNFLRAHLGTNTKYAPLDRYAGGTKGEPKMAVGIQLNEFKELALEALDPARRPAFAHNLSNICEGLSVDGTVWITLSEAGHPNAFADTPLPKRMRYQFFPNLNGNELGRP
jgi:hypothetical protein